jgi:hypothetical protein
MYSWFFSCLFQDLFVPLSNLILGGKKLGGV